MNEHEEVTQKRQEVPEHLRCRHVFIDGHRCGGYALRNEDYCYFHHETRRPAPNPQARFARRNSIQLPKPTSRANIQEAVGKVLTYLAFNDIDTRRAGLLLYALQIATLNLNQHNQEKQEKQEKQESGAIQPEPHNQQPTTSNQQPASDDSFHEDAFATPPSLHPLSRPIAAALLADLAKHHGVEPSPGSPEDRKPTGNETILPALQAECATHTLGAPFMRSHRMIGPFAQRAKRLFRFSSRRPRETEAMMLELPYEDAIRCEQRWRRCCCSCLSPRQEQLRVRRIKTMQRISTKSLQT